MRAAHNDMPWMSYGEAADTGRSEIHGGKCLLIHPVAEIIGMIDVVAKQGRLVFALHDHGPGIEYVHIGTIGFCRAACLVASDKGSCDGCRSAIPRWEGRPRKGSLRHVLRTTTLPLISLSKLSLPGIVEASTRLSPGTRMNLPRAGATTDTEYSCVEPPAAVTV